MQVSLTVNGTARVADVEPRTHLADFLRGHLGLTGTHLGCEQGVCGACTVMIDGRPQRSCIAYAVDCDGSEITTIEGFDSDPTMAALRDAFSAKHALQCGFCTPGMLITARDLVLRLGEMPESRIRHELSGNICRCTGYVGIVAAIGAVCAGRQPSPAAVATAAEAAPPEAAPAPPQAAVPVRTPTLGAGGNSLEQTIAVAAPAEAVWRAMADLHRVAGCLPGAELDTIDGEQIAGRIRVSFGPIRVAFAGTGTVQLDPAGRTGRMSGSGRDRGSGSAAEGGVEWRVVPDPATGGCTIAVVLTWRLSGALAQFNRAGLVADVVRRLAGSFATNLEASLAHPGQTSAAKPLSLFALLWSLLKSRLLGRAR